MILNAFFAPPNLLIVPCSSVARLQHAAAADISTRKTTRCSNPPRLATPSGPNAASFSSGSPDRSCSSLARLHAAAAGISTRKTTSCFSLPRLATHSGRTSCFFLFRSSLSFLQLVGQAAAHSRRRQLHPRNDQEPLDRIRPGTSNRTATSTAYGQLPTPREDPDSRTHEAPVTARKTHQQYRHQGNKQCCG